MVAVHSNLNFSRFQVLLTRCKSSLTVWREATIIGLSSESEESCYVDKKTSETSGKKITKEQLSENGICLFSDRIFNDLICIFHFYFPAVSPGTANNFCSDTSEFSRCLQFLDRNRHAAARISDFVFRCTTGNSVRTHPQYIYQWKIFYLCHFKDCQRGLP